MESAAKIQQKPFIQTNLNLLREWIDTPNESLCENRIRVLGLVDEIIKFDSSNYTAWWLRRKVLEESFKNNYLSREEYTTNLLEEVKFVRNCTAKEIKSYQIWNYRKFLIKEIGQIVRQDDIRNLLEEELISIKKLLADDKRNYQTWSYRTYLVRQFGPYHESDFELDPDNPSSLAFNVFFMEFKNPQNYEEEIDRAFDLVKEKPHQETSWAYLNSVCQKEPEGNKNIILLMRKGLEEDLLKRGIEYHFEF
eukprot:GHVP01038417.1.p2 GENE.GHVP01038417.1~~GHVP01038417.1.p2  ORF type:complete len:251 (+),score=53.41 GHVP01038417.1:1009-1761(+)